MGTRRIASILVTGLVVSAVVAALPTSAGAQTEELSPAKFAETVCGALTATKSGDDAWAKRFASGPQSANFGPAPQAAIDDITAYQKVWADAAAALETVSPKVSDGKKITKLFVEYANRAVGEIQQAIDKFKTVDPSSSGYTTALNSFGYAGGVTIRPALGDPLSEVRDGSVRKAFAREATCDGLFASLVDSPVTEFRVPSTRVNVFDITSGPDGNIWFNEFTQKRIGRIDPATGKVAEFPVPMELNSVTAGPDGNIWFTERDVNSAGPFAMVPTVALKVGKFDPETKKATTYAIPTTANARPTGITRGPDGNIWFGERTSNQIGKIDPDTGAVTLFPIPTANARPESITAGPDGNLWFVERANQIGKIDPATGAITEYPVPTANANPFGITTGPDKKSLWFTEVGANQIGKIDAATGAITEFPVPVVPGDALFGIAAGCDGNLWFTENNATQIGKIDPETGKVTEFPVPTANSQPAWITSGPDGNLWFAEEISDQIGKIDPGVSKKQRNSKQFKACAQPPKA